MNPSVPRGTAFADWLGPLHALCERAGKAIVEHYRGDGAAEHQSKADSSPLTAADIAAHEILTTGLEAFGLPILSEESDEEVVCQRHDWQRYWLVDPLDGTREFLERTGEFTINIALVEQGRARLGVIAVPLQDSCYFGEPGVGAWKVTPTGRIEIRCRSLGETGVVLTSRRHRGELLDACLERFAGVVSRVERRYIGSALKFCLLAEGVADFYPRFSPCSEWDTAAGQALLEAAGGQLVTILGEPLLYNQGEDLLNPHFLAMADPGSALWREML